MGSSRGMAEPAEMLLLVISDVLLEQAAPHPRVIRPLREGRQGTGKENTKINPHKQIRWLSLCWVLVSAGATVNSRERAWECGQGKPQPRGGGLFVCLFVWEATWGYIITPHSSTLSNSTSHTWEVPDCPGQVWMHLLWPHHAFERLPPKHKSWAPTKPRQSSWEAPAALGPGQPVTAHALSNLHQGHKALIPHSSCKMISSESFLTSWALSETPAGGFEGSWNSWVKQPHPFPSSTAPPLNPFEPTNPVLTPWATNTLQGQWSACLWENENRVYQLIWINSVWLQLCSPWPPGHVTDQAHPR